MPDVCVFLTRGVVGWSMLASRSGSSVWYVCLWFSDGDFVFVLVSGLHCLSVLELFACLAKAGLVLLLWDRGSRLRFIAHDASWVLADLLTESRDVGVLFGVRACPRVYHTTLKSCHGVQRLRLTAPRSAPFCDECKYKQVFFTCILHVFFFCRVTGCTLPVSRARC